MEEDGDGGWKRAKREVERGRRGRLDHGREGGWKRAEREVRSGPRGRTEHNGEGGKNKAGHIVRIEERVVLRYWTGLHHSAGHG